MKLLLDMVSKHVLLYLCRTAQMTLDADKKVNYSTQTMNKMANFASTLNFVLLCLLPHF